MAAPPETQIDALTELFRLLESKGTSPVPENPDDVPLDDDSKVTDTLAPVKFEGSEHRSIGDAVKLCDINGKEINSFDYVVQVIQRENIALTFGRVISLAGDFYSNRKPGNLAADYAPICGAYFDPEVNTPEIRFKDMIDYMLSDDWKYMKAVSGALDLEKSEIDRRKGADGGDAAATFHKPQDMHGDAWFILKTSDAYGKMAWMNADHFGNDALFVYKVGHALACNAAVDAGATPGDKNRAEKLNMAYFIEACALHYLTDLFSSGHMRAPRRAFHYDDWITMQRAGLEEEPVWDAMCRIMHDDDNSTGLFCRNTNGDNWIAFGDKQFFMPANGPNRARVIYTAQQSVNEVFSYFQNPLQPGSIKLLKNPSRNEAFATLPLIPSVTPSVMTESKWRSTLMDNPAPLWVAEQQNVKPSVTQKWRYRGQMNDHAAYTLKSGHPGFKDENAIIDNSPTEEGQQIEDAPFRGDDQFPKTIAVQPQAGVVQLAQTGNTWSNPNTFDEWLIGNVWTPVRFPNQPEIPQTITLRDKTLWNYRKDYRDTPLIHALGFSDAAKTMVLVFRLQRGTNNMNATCVDIQDPNQGKPSQWDYVAGTPQSKINVTVRWSDKPVFVQEDTGFIDMRNLRCFVMSTSAQRPFLASAVIDFSNSVYYNRTYLDDASTVNGNFTVLNWNRKDSPDDPDWTYNPFLKAWKSGPDTAKRQIFFCQHSAVVDNRFNLRAAALQLTDLDGKEDFQWSQNIMNWKDVKLTLRCPVDGPYKQIRSSCFLVGDMIGVGKWPITQAGNQCDQVAGVTISPTYLQLDVSGWREGEASFSKCQHDCVDDLLKGGPDGESYDGSGYLRDYILALVPSQLGSGVGSDILHISLHKISGKYWLKFKTHVNDRATRDGKPVPGRTLDYYGSCNVNWVQDDFMSKDRYESGRYQSLKWLYVPHSDPTNNRNAIMEIFSWYGILGMRYFAAQWDSNKNIYNYSLVGVQPYNGQPSMTMGRGIYGGWGEGFMTMGTTEGFIDVNYYNMVLGGAVGHGYWESGSKDTATKWNDPGIQGDILRRESDFVRGQPGDLTKLEN